MKYQWSCHGMHRFSFWLVEVLGRDPGYVTKSQVRQGNRNCNSNDVSWHCFWLDPDLAVKKMNII
jgi:hypothetical protein